MAVKTRPKEVVAAARWLRERAMMDAFVICPWCGGRHEVWEGDHVFPLLGVWGPMVAAGDVCNRRRQQRLQRSDVLERLFWDPRVLRSCPAEMLRDTARQGAREIFGSADWIGLLVAAVKGKKLVYDVNGKLAAAENERLRRVGLL